MQITSAISSEHSLTALISGHKTGRLLRCQETCLAFPHSPAQALLPLLHTEPCCSCGESDSSHAGSVSAEGEEEVGMERAGCREHVLVGWFAFPAPSTEPGKGDGVDWNSADPGRAQGFAVEAVKGLA